MGSTLSCLLPISSQSPPVTAKLDWVLCPCSILVADSGHGEPLDATQPVWGGSCCNLACFFVNNHHLNAFSEQISVLKRKS